MGFLAYRNEERKKKSGGQTQGGQTEEKGLQELRGQLDNWVMAGSGLLKGAAGRLEASQSQWQTMAQNADYLSTYNSQADKLIEEGEKIKQQLKSRQALLGEDTVSQAIRGVNELIAGLGKGSSYLAGMTTGQAGWNSQSDYGRAARLAAEAIKKQEEQQQENQRKSSKQLEQETQYAKEISLGRKAPRPEDKASPRPKAVVEDAVWSAPTGKEQKVELQKQMNFWQSLGYGTERLAQGLLGFGEGVVDLIGGGGDWLLGQATSLGGLAPNEVSAEFFKGADWFVQNDWTGDYGKSIEERYQPNDLERSVGNINQIGGSLLPSLATGQWAQGVAASAPLGNTLLQTVAPYTGTLTANLSNLGNSFGQARREGATLDQSMLYGVEQLASNVGIDLLTNGLPGLSEGLLPQSVSSALGGKRGVINSLSEALGGSLSEWWTPYLKRAVYDPQAEKAGAGEIARAALNQLAMAGMMNLGSWGAEKLDNALDARQPRSYGTKGKPVEPVGLGENGMRAYQTAYRGNVDVEEYAQGFELLYKAGKDGVVTVEQALRAAPDAVAVLGENGARQAYFSGQNDGVEIEGKANIEEKIPGQVENSGKEGYNEINTQTSTTSHGIENPWGSSEELIFSASAPGKGGVSPVGRAFQKHAGDSGRAGTFVGEVTGNSAKNTEQGTKYLEIILSNPNSSFTIRKTKAYGEVLDVRLPDGTGARWSADGKTFIGFLERYTKK